MGAPNRLAKRHWQRRVFSSAATELDREMLPKRHTGERSYKGRCSYSPTAAMKAWTSNMSSPLRGLMNSSRLLPIASTRS